MRRGAGGILEDDRRRLPRPHQKILVMALNYLNPINVRKSPNMR